MDAIIKLPTIAGLFLGLAAQLAPMSATVAHAASARQTQQEHAADNSLQESTDSSAPVTFNAHIAPIVHAKCASCHRPGQAGPFDLLTYDDVAVRARTIQAVIHSGYMPPWKPVNDNVRFANDRRLSQQEKTLIEQWIAQGKPRGMGNAPSPPKFAEGWMLGEPDLVVKMSGQFEVPASGPDIYRSFVFPVQLDSEKWIKAIEYRPSARNSVHHALFFVDPSGNARQMDGADGRPGIEGMGFISLANGESNADAQSSIFTLGRRTEAQGNNNSGFAFIDQLGRGLGGYAPGTTPTVLPEGVAMTLPRGSDIVMQTHFHPSGKAEIEQGELALYFTDQRPTRTLTPIQVPAMFGVGSGIRIPAGESDYVVRESFTVPVAVQLLNIGGHAHYIGRKLTMTAALPSGRKVVLLQIDDWDLDWQDRYAFAEPVILPAGTVLTSELVYDNSANNPENPNHPPQEIRWGRESGDEMGSITVMTVPVDEAESGALQSSLVQYYLKSITQGDIIELILQLDANRDGGLDKSEAPPRLAQRFRLLDRNRDGKLDRDELQVIRRQLETAMRLQNLGEGGNR